MLDPTIPDPSGKAATRDLERRVEALERANQLMASTIKGGSFRVFDENDNEIVRLGAFDEAGYDGFYVKDAAGTQILGANGVQGFSVPGVTVPCRCNTELVAVTAGTWTTAYTWTIEVVTAIEFRFRVPLTCDVGSTGEVRVYNNTGAAMIGNVKTLASGASEVAQFRATHGLTIGTGPINVLLQAQRTSGAGNVNVYEPSGLWVGANQVPVAGGWV